MYNEFNIERRIDSEKKKSKSCEKKSKLKEYCERHTLVLHNMTNKKPEDPTDILALKVSLPLMVNKSINQMLTRSIENILIKNEKEFTMTFVKDLIV